jgi:hypothetical protein
VDLLLLDLRVGDACSRSAEAERDRLWV